MSFLIMGDEVSYVAAESVALEKEIPVGSYQACFNQFRGTYLEKCGIKTSHGKIYGKSQQIANHIVEAFRLNSTESNTGVLLSGGRGLGKTLTTRLVIEQLVKTNPVIMISQYTPDLPKFLSHLNNCVILMDEFEKFMGGNVNGSDNENDTSKQESILSILDGNSTNSSNLFLLTVNDVYRVNENLLSRPGRIRYHFRYISESANIIREYCNDNLERKELTENVVKVLCSARYVSMDIITAFVDELNRFKNLSPEEAREFFNIELQDDGCTITFEVEIDGNIYKYSMQDVDPTSGISCEYFYLDELQKEQMKKDRDLIYRVPIHLLAGIQAEGMPKFLIGETDIDINSIEISSLTFLENEKPTLKIHELKLKKATIIDLAFKKMCKRNRIAF